MMMRRFGSILAVLSVLAVGSMVGAQSSRRAIPMSGAVVNAQGLPIAGASVLLLRHTTSAMGGEAEAIVAQGRTDQQGLFSLGSVALDTEIAFPLETGLRFDYLVKRDGASLEVAGVTFTAPRDGVLVASVAARISVR